ncbi:9744_t:CDS:2, partial [Entrophospora sp. SA101]
MPSIINNVTANYFELVISIKHKQETTIWSGEDMISSLLDLSYDISDPVSKLYKNILNQISDWDKVYEHWIDLSEGKKIIFKYSTLMKDFNYLFNYLRFFFNSSPNTNGEYGDITNYLHSNNRGSISPMPMSPTTK